MFLEFGILQWFGPHNALRGGAEVGAEVVVGPQGRRGGLWWGQGPAAAQRHQRTRGKSPGGSVQCRRQI